MNQSLERAAAAPSSSYDALVHAAIGAIAERADGARRTDLIRLGRALGRADGDDSVRALVDGIRRHARITLNFHPDRLDADGVSVAEGLLRTGRYRPQRETGLSNGGRSAVPGGERTQWERALFGNVYETAAGTHPIYGSLDLTHDPHGGSPRFGSCFVVLRQHCLDRATFCVGDSHAGPTDVGTIESLVGILAGLFESGASGNGLDRSLTVDDLERAILDGHQATRPARCLDGYIETQIHGGVSLGDDVVEIVLDPSFAGTDVEQHLAATAVRHRFRLGWHGGSELASADVPADFRGPTMTEWARRVAGLAGVVDAAAIGRTAARVPFTPPTPAGDPPASELQQLKYLWHCVLRSGRDAGTGA